MLYPTSREVNIPVWIFLRLLALCCLLAFVSYWLQFEGLVGHSGILPIAKFLPATLKHFGSEAYWTFPTLLWFNSSNFFLNALFFCGSFCSVLLFIGRAAPLMLFLIWILYLSLIVAGQEFFHFQWDSLLLETCFLSIFLAPWEKNARFSPNRAVSLIALWSLRILLFRLMFSSGVVKLLSGDESWRNLSALSFHYETQPLPNPLSWYMYQLPVWFHKLSAIFLFFSELLAIWLIFFPRKYRIYGFIPLFTLQVIILLTGNFCFFNLLSIALCLLVLDNQSISHFLPKRFCFEEFFILEPKESFRRRTLHYLSSLILILAVSLGMHRLLLPDKVLPGFSTVLEKIAPFQTINSYGVFAVMTTKRDEIIFEGSNDGLNWQAYTLPWKPEDPNQMPRQVAPHQPRLDWQLWFAALKNCQTSPWVQELMKQILRGNSDVLSLFAKNPFAKTPPNFLRAMRYQYNFTSFEEGSKSKAWWKRRVKGHYCPVMKR